MKVVLDTNVLVSGLLSPFSPSGEIVRMVSSGELALCIDARILTEYHEVLRRPKFRFDEDRVVALLDFVAYHGWTVASSPLLLSLPDPDDEPFLAAAVAGGAECLVTGNQAHFPRGLCQSVTVLSPAAFLQRYVKRQKDRGGVSPT